MFVGGGDEQFGEKVGPWDEPAAKWISSGLQSSTVMTTSGLRLHWGG